MFSFFFNIMEKKWTRKWKMTWKLGFRDYIGVICSFQDVEV